MKQLTYVKAKTLAFWDVPEPSLGSPCEALVRPFVAARCDGDSFFLRHDFDPLLRVGSALHVVDASFGKPHTHVFRAPFAYGHECVAEVVAVGDGVRGFAVHDVVVVPWTVFCGTCARCMQGLTAHCERASTPVAAYGLGKAMGSYGGMVSDLLRVPYADAMLVRVPDSVDPLAAASASDNMPDAYRAVGPQLAQRPGAPVLIVGGAAHSIGLYAAGMAVALGASRVDYIDSSRERLRIAERLGARAIPLTHAAAWFGKRASIDPEGYPIAVEASGTTSGLAYALSALTFGGVCTALAFYLRKGTPLPLWNMYMKSATLHVGVPHPRAHVPDVLRLIERGEFDPMKLCPLTGDWHDADRVLLEPAAKVIVSRRRLGPTSAVAPA